MTFVQLPSGELVNVTQIRRLTRNAHGFGRIYWSGFPGDCLDLDPEEYVVVKDALEKLGLL